MYDMGKILIYIGIALVIIGLLIYFGGKLLPLGKLPLILNGKVIIGAFIFL